MAHRFVLFTIAVLTLAIFNVSRAQEQQPNIDSAIQMIRDGMQADRTTIISQGMNFNDKDGAAFWPVYRKY